jgi:hypothetical protein
MLQTRKSTSADNGSCAQPRQPERDGSANSASAAGYQGNFAVQSMVHVLPSLTLEDLLEKRSSSGISFFAACRNVFAGPVSNLAGYRVLPMDRSKFDFHLLLIIRKEFVAPEGDDF